MLTRVRLVLCSEIMARVLYALSIIGRLSSGGRCSALLHPARREHWADIGPGCRSAALGGRRSGPAPERTCLATTLVRKRTLGPTRVIATRRGPNSFGALLQEHRTA